MDRALEFEALKCLFDKNCDFSLTRGKYSKGF